MATHWHDDHIRGLSQVLDTAGQAKFACSGALQCKELASLIAWYRQRPLLPSTGIDELNRAFAILEARKTTRKENFGPIWAIENRTIFSALDNGIKVIVEALSPSDTAMTNAYKGFSALMPNLGSPKSQLPPGAPNHSATVLHIKIDDLSIILGSDLEVTSDETDGWHSIVGKLSNLSADFLKIAHHGSKGAHHLPFWEQNIRPHSPAVLTPFYRGSVKLPEIQMCSQFASLSNQSYVAGDGELKPIKINNRVVRDAVARVANAPLIALDSRVGYVTARRNLPAGGSPWRISCFGSACSMPEYISKYGKMKMPTTSIA